MEAMNYTARHHRRIAVDPVHHASARAPSNTTALYAKFMNHQYRSGLESRPSLSHQRHVQDYDADAAIKEARSRSRANENRTPAMVAVKNNSVRRSIRGQDAAVLVVSESRIGGHHSHIDSDDEIASSLSRFAFPLPPSFHHNDELLVSNRAKSRRANKKLPSPSSSSSYQSTSTRPTSNYLTPQPQPHPHLPPHKSQHLSPARMATVALAVGSTFVSPLPPTVLPTVGRDRVILPTPSDVSEVQPDGFAEGEVLESEHNDAWAQHSPYHYTQHLNSARCSSSTLYEESRPPSRQNSKDVQSSMKHTQVQSKIDAPSSSLCNTPTWMMMGTPSKVEPATPSRGKNADSGVESSQGSPSLFTPTPSTPAGLDKAKKNLLEFNKNLLEFNKIPRQWPASQETLHHNYLAAAANNTLIKDIDPATAERIERVINRERAARERLAAEKKDAELEARGFFDPVRRWKGRDVYPRPGNWVSCRRTKKNWFDKTKILADQYKLFKGQALGKGHHADVFKGIDLTTGQDLAIKVVYKTVSRRLGCFVHEDSNQEAKNKKLLNEAWFLDHLKDAPGICKLLRVIETATKFYFVMELAQSDLNSYSNGINMREEEIRHILKPIFECLKFAHSKDITHRDIKPENILLKIQKDWVPASSRTSKRHSVSTKNTLTANDNASTLSSMFANESYDDCSSSIDSSTLFNLDHRFDATLADWGLAVEHDCNSGRKPVGTPLYAAPEVVRKMKRIRRKEWINYRACDIWSLGVTMFVIASGIYPYHTHEPLEDQAAPNWGALESSGMSPEYIALTQRLMNLTAELRPSAAEACKDPWFQA